MRRGMMELSVLQRDALTLVAVVGLSYREAATICGCAEGTVKSRVSRARKGLLVILARGVFTAEKRHPGRAMNAIVSEGGRLQSAAA